jgi:cellulose synthase/poly-beta-1,6-N-acetylglucosamine synthase-like glycosyltransferase
MNFPVLRYQPAERLAWPPISSSRSTNFPRPLGQDNRRPDVEACEPLLNEEALLLRAGVPASTVYRIGKLAQRWGVSVREAALSIGAVRPQSYLRALANACGLAPHQLRERVHIRRIAATPEPYRLLANAQPAPLETPRGSVAINAQDIAPEAVARLAGALGPAKQRLVLATRAALSASIARAYGADLAIRAADGLRERNPRFSAATGLIRWQIVALTLLAGLFAGAAVFTPIEAMIVYSAALSAMFLLTILLRLAAASYACIRHVFGHKTRYRRQPDSALPRYTVLVAMYRETRVLPQLVAGLRALDYPVAKLDIKLVLEEVDAETIAMARALKLPPHFEIVIVPDGTPRTKPRALNYAVQFASGEYLVIFDAEDRPDPNQLRKAAAHFKGARPEVVCLQGKLTFDNAAENWLAKQFTVEYASLFGGILPMLDKLRLPMPLGGTSNHFRADILRKLGGWDAYNVTEDADLGMRIYRAGLRAEVLDSVTYEEAACQPGNWLGQRTRWLKGWMQTYCVHMRQPLRLLRELGWPGFLSVQGHFAGIIVAALVHPWSYVLIINEAASGSLFDRPETLFGQHILALAFFNLVAGYAASLALGFFVLQGRRTRMLIPQLIFIPFYWLLISAAAYRALYQLATRPHYWEKTEHGVSKIKRGTQSGRPSRGQ